MALSRSVLIFNMISFISIENGIVQRYNNPREGQHGAEEEIEADVANVPGVDEEWTHGSGVSLKLNRKK